MNHFIEVKDESGKTILLNVDKITHVQQYGNKVMVAFGQTAVMVGISYKELKNLLGLTKKR